ncbi:hypothetical protein GFJ91_21400, partial [Salmonella enterica subsp. enterica serovar Enteritidis]|nr:hypothetical protein [Salmonella enterica subsp. enterica serovar Enteritidis]
MTVRSLYQLIPRLKPHINGCPVQLLLTSLSVCNKAPNHRFLLSVGYAQLNALNEFLPESLAQ